MDESRAWGRVGDLFHQALELGPEEREAMLREVEGRDAALAAEVRSLLASHVGAADFLEKPILASLLGAVAPGDRLGPYRIVEEIGHGGMGVVFRAVRDDEHFSKEVAIKLIEPGMRSEEILKRFRDERQILAMLDHPHIARLLDGGSAPDGSPYLVMEYVSGKPLPAYCDERRLSIEERLALFVTVCDAAQFAHQHLVVHRDLKADNILVTEDGSPRLLDFGIAKLMSPEKGPATVTAPMHRLLTPDYASPEQVRGEPVTVAGDVYSLGVILYELLTGVRPLRFETRTPEEILRVVTQVEPVAPSSAIGRSGTSETATLRGSPTTARLRRRLAGDLDFIALKALEKDPARRYATAEQLARDLRRFLDNLPIQGRGRTTAYHVSRFVRRHRVAVVTGGLVALSLIAGLAGTAWQAHVAGRERDRAKRRFDEVRALAHAVVFDMHDAIVGLQGSTRAREILVEHALQYLNSLSREAEGDPSLQHELGVAYGKIGDVQGRPMFPNLGRTPDAHQSYRRSLDLLRAASAACPDSLGFSRDLVVTMQRLGDLLGRMGKPQEALRMELDAKALIVAQRTRHPDDLTLQGDFGVSADRLADLKAAAGDTLGAIAEGNEGMVLVEGRYRKSPTEPDARRNLMVAYAKQARLLAAGADRATAARYYRLSQDLAAECVRALPNNADAQRDLGVVYGMRAMFLAESGEVDSALALYRSGLKISERLAVADTSDALQAADLANSHTDMGTLLTMARRHREAEAEFGEAYARLARLAARDTSNAETRTNMARASRHAGESCRRLASRAGSAAERAHWRARAADWYGKSLKLYRALSAAGALSGGETGAVAEVERLLAMVGKTNGPAPE